MLRICLPLTILACGATLARAELCPAWSEPEGIGTLDVGLLPEASGIEISSDGSRFYLINDGTQPVFHVTNPAGRAEQRVRIAGFRPLDLEDIAIGPCAAGDCLYLADIGDNARRRANVQIALVAESTSFAAEVPARRVVVARYPDGPHDAEAIAIHPSGDLWLVTKSPLGRPAPAALFRLTAAQLTADGEQTFEHVADIPVRSLAQGSGLRRMVTGMDITADGQRFALLTYDLAFEFAIDPGAATPVFDELVEGSSYRSIATATLIQAEAIAYTADGQGLVYTTESIRGSASPIMRQTCAGAERDQAALIRR